MPRKRILGHWTRKERKSSADAVIGKGRPDEVDVSGSLSQVDGVCGRFRRLAARYGFIERYQRGKEEVTGISAEPWHFRYVGAPHAQLMETNGLCLEEYRDFLRQGPRSVALENGRMAQVFYVPAAGAVTEVEVPEGCCQISGDNVEGFILTWWGDTHENG